MKSSSRISAIIEILQSIDETKIPADKIVSFWNKNNRYAGSKDKSYIAGAVYTILRVKAQLAWWVKKYNLNAKPRTITIAYIHFFGGKISELFKDYDNEHAPAILNNAEQTFIDELESVDNLRHKDMPLHVSLNIQEWLLEKFQNVYGNDTAKAIKSFSSEASVDIRVNTLKSNIEEVRKALQTDGLDIMPITGIPNGIRLRKRRPLSGLESFRNGWFEIQDSGSQLVSLLINPKRGDKIVDFCAGAGGKTLAIAPLLNNTGKIISCDISEKRLERAGKRFRRADVNNAERRLLSSERDKWVKRRSVRFDGGFDKVVIDAPCTGTGTWRRNPDQKWRTTETNLAELMQTQANILYSSSRLVAQGGKLIYITCSLLKEENEYQIERFLTDNKNFHLVNIKNVWDDVFDTPCPTEEKTLRISPHINDSDGFFIAIIERKIVETQITK